MNIEILSIFSGRLAVVRIMMLLSAAALFGIGMAAIYSAGNPLTDSDEDKTAFSGPDNPNIETITLNPDKSNPNAGAWKKQLVFAAAGLLSFFIVNLVDYRRLGQASYWIYGVVLVLLMIILLDKWVDIPFVPYVKGARRWIRLGTATHYIQIQPSEFCKIAYIMALAWYLRFRSNYRHLVGLAGPFALTVLAMALILLEPDLGTTMLLMPMLFSMLFVAGARVRHLLLFIGLAIIVSPLLWTMLHDYQKMRISCVLLQNDRIFQAASDHPTLARILVGSPSRLRDWKKNEGYHLMHSKQAIASGGLMGYGYGKGPYSQYEYLPERHNDFIFALIAHQWGFWGGVLVMLLYGILFACGAEIAYLNTDPFARLTAVGIIAMFAVEVAVNVSMTLGLMPITGLTLPFVSYGGSSLMVNMIALGLLNNIGRFRPFSVAGKPFEHFQ
ncbi:FtsW/RodA/SpoVE family cell cycle protein [Anaerohalosphaeraceae bacterium U12dextr]